MLPSGWRVRLKPRSMVKVREQGGGRWRTVQSRKATSEIVRVRISGVNFEVPR